jgi:hypothetical protein
LLIYKNTSLLCKFVPLFNHVQQVPQVLVCSRQPLDMVAHPDHQNRTADNILTAKPVLARLMNLANDGLISRYPIRPVLLIPLNPLAPLFDSLLAVEFPRDWEAGDGVDVGVEGLSLFDGLVLVGEDLLDFGLVGFDLGEFAVSNSEGVLAVHWIEMVNFINKRYTQISCGEINLQAWFLFIFTLKLIWSQYLIPSTHSNSIHIFIYLISKTFLEAIHRSLFAYQSIPRPTYQ